MSDEVQVEDRGPVRWLVVDRYERRNAWTLAMVDQLADLLPAAAADPGIRALVVAGRGGCFSSGIDRSVLDSDVQASAFPVEEFLRFPKPTVACVDGAAFGMGCTLAVGCDLRVASTRATFTLGFGRLGLTPEWGASFLLWREVGWSRALDMALSDRTVEAEEAFRIGLADRLVEPGDVEQAAQAVAERFASLPEGVAETTKRVMWGGLEQLTLSGARAVELQSIYEQRMATPSSEEA